MRCPPDLVGPVVVPMDRTREDEKDDGEVDPTQRIFPRLGPRILLARRDQTWWAAVGDFDTDSFRQVVKGWIRDVPREKGSEVRGWEVRHCRGRERETEKRIRL